RLHPFTVSFSLPDRIGRLADLARNVWWSWNPQARALFERLDGRRFEALEGNPVRLLRALDAQALAAAARDAGFLAAYDAVLAEFDGYLARKPAAAPATAYFCAEFAIHESLPIFSGGLGVLAGDHLKSASDLALPIVAVGLRYRDGYFRQRIEADGRQAAEFSAYDPRETPLQEATGADGAPLRIAIPMPERELKAGVWRLDVGSIPLFLLDTLVPENDPADREVTDRLYPSEREPRLRQEILLGRGGWRLLRALGRAPQVCHLNEGHSAFLLLERLLDLVESKGLTYAEAAEVVRAGTAFTTHTPVPAGHDRFAEGLMRRYFSHVAQRLGLDWEEFLALGGGTSDSREFSMTALALRLSGRSNAVSRRHGEVSRKLNADVWPGLHPAEAPIDAITNGVHLPTWVGPEVDALFDRHLAPTWRRADPERLDWTRLESLPDAELWAARTAQRKRFLDLLRRSVEETGLRRGERPARLRRRLEGARGDALWIGIARRFAPYKRATLLFRDAERLAALLDNAERPVRVVFAGKSHPNDAEGAELVRTVVELTTDDRFSGRVFFVEDYGLAAARALVQGVDVWLNTPTRPLEASGTSGMKACANGVLHLSVLDGWWCEGNDGSNGWTVGEGREYENPEMQNEHDARTLYARLEGEIAPLFFDRDAAGLPGGGLARVKRALATVPAWFNTHRMVADYLRRVYAPLGRAVARLENNEHAEARAAARRHRQLRDGWKDVRIA
ncbi:MAG: alpha-glucan family phosphorylase, partial [Planctomycetota bacterium]